MPLPYSKHSSLSVDALGIVSVQNHTLFLRLFDGVLFSFKKERNFDFILVYFLKFSLFIISSSTPTGILCSSIVKKGRNFTFSWVPKTPQLRPPTSCSAGPKVQNTGTSEGQRTNNVNPEGKNEKSARKCRPFQLQFIDGMTRHQIIYS